MTILEQSMVDCVMLDKVSVDDGIGGLKKVYVDGAGFKSAIPLDNSITARIAEKDGVTNLYTVYTRKNINLQKHDVFKRLEDGKIFRVTSDGDDDKTPTGAQLNLRKVSAEEWSLDNADDGNEI